LLRNGFTLDFWQCLELQRWLDRYPELRELYQAKEALHRFYRTRGIDRASHAFRSLIDTLASSNLPEVQTLRRTLLRWRAKSWLTSTPASPTAEPRASTSRQSSSNAELSDIDPSETIDCGS
jgi:hypothetical protein